MPPKKILGTSKEFVELNKNIKIIEKNLLPKIKLTGTYTEREKNLVRGYLLLAHAEIESYFEEIANNVVLSAHSKWEKTKKPSHIITSLIAYLGCKSQEVPESINDTSRALIEKRVKESLDLYVKYLKQNHGIKQKNILRILLPLGIPLNEIDSAWLLEMDTFGDDRGEIAHHSIKVQKIIDPSTEQKRVERVLVEIKKIDSLVISLK
jgi:hypothetical protein